MRAQEMKHMLYMSAAFTAGALTIFFLDRLAARPARFASGKPASDTQVRERVRARLGHLVSHPRAIAVEVNEGIVRLSGHVLTKEIDGLLTQLTGMAGVRKVQNALSTLNDPSAFGQPTGTISGAREPVTR
jgi:hypothetical protein